MKTRLKWVLIIGLPLAAATSLALLSAPWQRVEFRNGVIKELTGSTLAPLATSLGFLILLIAVLLLLVRARARMILAILAALSAVLAGSSVAPWVFDPLLISQAVGDSLPVSGPAVENEIASVTATLFPLGTFVAFLSAAGVALVISATTVRWPEAAVRFERKVRVTDLPAGKWDALDAGVDPTASDEGSSSR